MESHSLDERGEFPVQVSAPSVKVITVREYLDRAARNGDGHAPCSSEDSERHRLSATRYFESPFASSSGGCRPIRPPGPPWSFPARLRFLRVASSDVGPRPLSRLGMRGFWCQGPWET